MKHIKCLKLSPETICECLKKNYQPVCISDVELNLNELAASLIESLMERIAEFEHTVYNNNVTSAVSEDIEELDESKPTPKPGRLIASYLIST